MTDGKVTKRNWKRTLATAIICGASVMSLQGCFEMFVGTAVVGTLAATDRRTFGAQTEDKSIMLKGETRAANLVGNEGHVNVTSFNRRVLITGEVKSEAVKAAVEREIKAIENVQAVFNELAIAPPSSYSARANDSFITSKVTASFVDAKDVFSNSLKTVTERGTVYLMGRVTQREGTRAAEIASGVNGVQKVVKLFEYITEDELKRITSSTQPTQAPQ